jgi:hypothetical protein
VFLRALPQLQAERQLAAIEASVFPHMKPEDAKRVAERHRQATKPPEEPRPAALALLDGFRSHGLAVVEQPTTKPSA